MAKYLNIYQRLEVDFIATTRLMTLHIGKGKTIGSALGRTVDYVENPDKTNDCEFISSYECDPLIAEQQFLFTKSQYTRLTGRTQGDKDVIAYHLRQSFKPNEITAEVANKIGYDLAMSLTKGKHAFIVCTHIDKAHIHSHIVFNSTTLDSTKKFRNFWNSHKAVRKISDRLCLENGVSTIENPKQAKGSYATWLGEKPPTFSDKLRVAIDEVLANKPISFEDFMLQMKAKGFECKTGKYIAFKGAGQKKFIRIKSLGDDYSEEKIRAVIDGKSFHVPRAKQEKKVNLLVDIQAKLNDGKGKGYENWAKVFNLKQMAKTINYLQENNLLNYDELTAKSDAVTKEFYTLSNKLKELENRMKYVSELQKYIVQFARTKAIYEDYRKSGYSANFKENNITEILLHQASKKYFKELGLKNLPKIADLKSENDAIFSEKKKLYSSYNIAKKEMQELSIAKQNVKQILELNKPKKSKEKSLLQR